MSIKLPSALVCIALAAGCGGPRTSGQEGGTLPADPVATEDAAAEAEDAAARLVEDLAARRWSALGHPVVRWDAIPAVRAPREKPHQLLVVLVEFADVGFTRYRGAKDQGTRLAAHYQERLFDGDYARKDTLSHYYRDQSSGAYHVTGKVLPPVKLTRPRRFYGGPHRPAGGDWRNDGDVETMVEEALSLAAKANPGIGWSDFDRWDPTDFDKDGNTDEPDGYLDHFVLVFAGGGQSSCQLLNQIGDVLTPNVGPEALAQLDRRQRECADRPWPHRDAVRRRETSGPAVAGEVHRRGGVPLQDGLWVYDYNMQSEYTEASTFIHEFGHSIGLPDVYARTSSNSTGPWEVMSSTTAPSPQSLSAWSRMQLGWLEPRVILPPAFGGESAARIELANLEDVGSAAPRAAMVILPPKHRVIELTSLPEGSRSALYSGQGNEMNRTAELRLDLSKAAGAAIEFDAWWEIEAGWDFAYAEISSDGGQSWKRALPVDRRHMPAEHGHDGKKTTPGFTGLSGDLDGDGKNESASGCDPKVAIEHGEDRAGAEKSPCLEPSWVRVGFDLSAHEGAADVRFRLRYYTDGAAVMRGILIDNVAVAAVDVREDFEGPTGERWRLDGFSPSPGRHELLVPHFYVIEHRDPQGSSGYDSALAEPSYAFYWDPEGDRMLALELKVRPGVVIWYFDGAYAWSENDPAINGPGKGYLLALDANPNEIALPGLASYLSGSAEGFEEGYDVSGAAAQAALAESWKKTVCFVRSTKYLPRGLPTKRPCPGAAAPVQKLTIEGKRARYSYEVVNELLPGDRDGLKRVGELVDVKERGGERSYRLRDRSLRTYHTFDAPLAREPFPRGLVLHEVKGNQLVEIEAREHPAVPRFDDRVPGRWLNPRLPFGGVAVPSGQLELELVEPGPGAAAAIELRWRSE